MIINNEFLAKMEPLFIKDYFNFNPEITKVTPKQFGDLWLTYKLPTMMDDFSKNHREINRIQGRVGIYLSTDKEFTEIANRCDVRFMEKPHDLYNFVVWYSNHFSFRVGDDDSFNWNKKHEEPVTVNIDYKPIMEKVKKGKKVYLQVILQLYFYQINQENYKINLSDYSVRMPFNLMEIDGETLLKQTSMSEEDKIKEEKIKVIMPEMEQNKIKQIEEPRNVKPLKKEVDEAKKGSFNSMKTW